MVIVSVATGTVRPSLTVVVGLGLLAAGCGSRPSTMAPLQPTMPCRSAISADGRLMGLGAIEWFHPEPERDRIELAEWCSAVGPSVLRAVPAGNHDSRTQHEIGVLSWNVNGGNGDAVALIGQVMAGDFDRRDAERHLIILLQETYRQGSAIPMRPASGLEAPSHVGDRTRAYRASVVDLATRFGLAFAYVPSMRNGRDTAPERREDKGNAILSTLPLENVFAVEIPFEKQRRVAVGVTIEVMLDREVKHLRVVNVHFDTRPGADHRRQARGLLMVVDSLVSPAPTLLAGDFNTWHSRASALELIRADYSDIEPLDGPFITAAPRIFADHMFLRSRREWVGQRYCMVRDRRGSDHNALVARLTLVGVRTMGGIPGCD